MPGSLDDAIRSAVSNAVASNKWNGVTRGDHEGEGWLQSLDVEDSDIDYPEDIADPSDFIVAISGLGTVVFKNGDGDENESEEDVRVTARIAIGADTVGDRGEFNATIAADIRNVSIEA
jgi:hypothetical protein